MKQILTITKITSIIIVVFIVSVFVLAFIDYKRIKNLEEPKFCLEKNTYEYDDGAALECVGIGYKVIEYHRTSFEGVEFGGMWSKVKTDFSKYKK